MSIARISALVARNLRQGPRSPVFIWALLMPVFITFMVQVVLLTLFDPKPRLGIADLGRSEITAAVRRIDGIDLTTARSAAELRALVEDNDVDAGLVLAEGFDAAVRAGERPELEFYVSGGSYLMNRVVLAVTALDLVRRVEGREAPAEVVLNTVGGREALPVSDLIVLGLVLFVLLMTGMFVPAFMLVEEREQGTLDAVLVTPATMSEVLISKAAIGFAMAVVMSLLILVANGALSADLPALLAVLAVAAAVCTEIGLIYGTVARDAKGLYTLMKSLNIIILAPMILYFFPDLPQWIAKIFPTYWFIDPLYRIALRGASLADVWAELAVALAISALLAVLLLRGK